MSFVAVGPEAVFSAAKALERVGSELTGAGSAAARTTAAVFDYATLLGPIRLTPDVMGTAVTAGTLDVATPHALAFDAISPPLASLLALQGGGAAFVSAVQSGNAALAAQTFVETPVNAVKSFSPADDS